MTYKFWLGILFGIAMYTLVRFAIIPWIAATRFGIAVRKVWDWVFPWRYLRNARRECKHCGTRQDTYSTNWSDGHNSYWYETMAPVYACKRINHGEVYPAPIIPPSGPGTTEHTWTDKTP